MYLALFIGLERNGSKKAMDIKDLPERITKELMGTLINDPEAYKVLLNYQ